MGLHCASKKLALIPGILIQALVLTVDVGSVHPSPELCNEVSCSHAVNTYLSTLGRHTQTYTSLWMQNEVHMFWHSLSLTFAEHVAIPAPGWVMAMQHTSCWWTLHITSAAAIWGDSVASRSWERWRRRRQGVRYSRRMGHN